MENSTFCEGIAPGGLREQPEIKLLICYLLKALDKPLTRTQINEILQEYPSATYQDYSQLPSENVHYFSSSKKSLSDSEALIAEREWINHLHNIIYQKYSELENQIVIPEFTYEGYGDTEDEMMRAEEDRLRIEAERLAAEKEREKIAKERVKDLLFFAIYIKMEHAEKINMLSRLYKNGDERAFCV